MKTCDCSSRMGIKINSLKMFDDMKHFFDEQEKIGVFSNVSVDTPYYIWIDKTTGKKVEWYADKWYRCTVCGTLWEFNYPNFPSAGFIKKYPDGIYTGKEVRESGY